MLVVQVCFGNLDSGCSKHMDGNRSKLIDFCGKGSSGSVNSGMITRSYQWVMVIKFMGDSVISRVVLHILKGIRWHLFVHDMIDEM
ncbi:hypothetical protein Tco_1123239 [Tanacetum coccineum]|uniref:Uncharacterized protein n=1 Tax=Tanacetum coccineum TaxID=301880 RepID=A0ABQ5J6I8_9ASTR